MTIETRGDYDMHDLTGAVADVIVESGIANGLVTVFVAHTTAAVVITEVESGLETDIRTSLEQIAPSTARYQHNLLNADDNAHSHLLGTIIGPSESVPLADGRLVLGTWQRIVLLDLDTHPRRRQCVVQVLGE